MNGNLNLNDQLVGFHNQIRSCYQLLPLMEKLKRSSIQAAHSGWLTRHLYIRFIRSFTKSYDYWLEKHEWWTCSKLESDDFSTAQTGKTRLITQE